MSGIRFAGLGDSYAAGVGGAAPTDSCWRTADAYPVVVAAALHARLDLQACIGATTADVKAHQLGSLSADTTDISITVGGNDLHFTKVLTELAMPAWMADDSVLDDAVRIMHHDLPGRYAALFADVRERAPRAQVIVVGYPRLFDGVDCSLFTFFSVQEMTRLNDAADELAAVMRRSAERADFEFVDVRDTFEGHAVCDDDAWIHDVRWPLEESFHPTAAGYSAYARQVAAAFGVREVRERVGPVEGGRPAAVTYGPCRATPPPTFSPPDLTCRRSLDGARAHGLDPTEVAELGRRLNASTSSQPDTEAHQRLCRLDDQVRTRR